MPAIELDGYLISLRTETLVLKELGRAAYIRNLSRQRCCHFSGRFGGIS